MERTISVEEKIRRAEEIYEKRQMGNSKQIATVSVKREKKDIKLLKKMIIQILICGLLYFIIYAIKNNEYIFSQDCMDKLRNVLSYDTNFPELYENAKSWVKEVILKNNQEKDIKEGIGGATIEQPQAETKIEENKENDNENITEEQSQEEKDINEIKATTTFIKPVEGGTISSKFGLRETATGNVPKNHTGTDIAANLGTKIISSTNGEVVLASEEGDYGKHLKIQIGEVSIIYAHCNELYVKQGDKVSQGQEIAEVGSTGNSTRTALAF